MGEAQRDCATPPLTESAGEAAPRAARGGDPLVLTVSKNAAHRADADTIGGAIAMVAAARRAPATIYVHVGCYREAPLLLANDMCVEGLAARPGERLPCPLHLPRPVLVPADAGQPIIRCSGKGNVLRNFHLLAPDSSAGAPAVCAATCRITQPVAQPVSTRGTVETRAAGHGNGLLAGAGIAAGVDGGASIGAEASRVGVRAMARAPAGPAGSGAPMAPGTGVGGHGGHSRIEAREPLHAEATRAREPRVTNECGNSAHGVHESAKSTADGGGGVDGGAGDSEPQAQSQTHGTEDQRDCSARAGGGGAGGRDGERDGGKKRDRRAEMEMEMHLKKVLRQSRDGISQVQHSMRCTCSNRAKKKSAGDARALARTSESHSGRVGRVRVCARFVRVCVRACTLTECFFFFSSTHRRI